MNQLGGAFLDHGTNGGILLEMGNNWGEGWGRGSHFQQSKRKSSKSVSVDLQELVKMEAGAEHASFALRLKPCVRHTISLTEAPVTLKKLICFTKCIFRSSSHTLQLTLHIPKFSLMPLSPHSDSVYITVFEGEPRKDWWLRRPIMDYNSSQRTKVFARQI